jgi:hypothetical protein
VSYDYNFSDRPPFSETGRDFFSDMIKLIAVKVTKVGLMGRKAMQDIFSTRFYAICFAGFFSFHPAGFGR